MSGFSEFTLNDTTNVLREKSQRFKVEDGKSYRLSLVWWGDNPEFNDDAPKFIKAARYYKEGLGYVIHDQDNDREYRELLKDRPRDVFATVCIVWQTDDGALDTQAFASGKGYKVLPWIMSQDKLSTLLRVHKNFGLGNVDLAITCPKGGGQYQKMEVMPVNRSVKGCSHGNLYRLANESKKDPMKKLSGDINAAVASIVDGLRDQIGRQYTIPEIKEKLYGTTATGGGTVGADNPDDVLDNILPY